MKPLRFVASIPIWFMGLLLLFILMPAAAWAGKVTILEVDINSYQVYQAVKQVDLPASLQVRYFTLADLTGDPAAKSFIADSKVVLVNVMMTQLADYMVDEELMDGRMVYALNRAGDPEDLAKKGFCFDATIMDYYHHRSVTNLINMVRLAVNRHMDASVSFKPLEKVPEVCIHHPDAPRLYENLAAFNQWNAARKNHDSGNPRVGILFYGTTLKEGQVEAADDLIRQLENAGFNVLPCFGPVQPIFDRYLKPVSGQSPVDMILAFSMKFSSGINDGIRSALAALNVPVFNVIRPYAETIEAWRQSDVGLGPMETVWAVATPEFSGAIEPTVLIGKKEIVDKETGRHLFVYETVQETIDFLIPRLKKWAALQRMPNEKKKVAIIYYNHSQGKQNIAAAYLNVFRSLQFILTRMQKEGYAIERADALTEEKIQQWILDGARNVGSWAPGELDALLAAGEAETVSLAEYQIWFDRLPEAFRKPVRDQWGRPEDCTIMTKDGRLVFPMVKLGNVVLLPEPARGWTDDPMKLYHDTTLYPHHQYIAAYLWLSEKFHADAMIHLGTHATYEWLPGKQAGLAPWDPPEIMSGAIPNLYPYIVDDIGEGIEAKRRGRGVILDHLTPPMKEADLHHEYRQIHDLFHQYEIAHANGSETAEEYMRQIMRLVEQTGIAKDLSITTMDDAAMEKIHLYLHEIDTNSLPYGLHTYGKPYDTDAADETVRLILQQNPTADRFQVTRDLSDSAVLEMDNLMRGLNGAYVPAGEGNDPLRNLAAIPTGKDFYGFSSAKVPSKAAWDIGKRAADQMIAEKLKKEGRYPQKVGVVLWATETTRNEGVNESTVLYLMGVEPVWDATERVTGSRVIPGSQLGRPRIDVLINPSGLYRDMFPNKLIFLDEAVQKAMLQTDIDNFLSRNQATIKETLIASGMDADEAEMQSRFRIFTEKPGSYGNGVEEMIGASGLWEADDAVSNVYLNRTQFAVGQGRWAVPVKSAFTENLRGVDIAVHSRSTNVIGIIDTDDFFMYLGGMSLAVKNVKGEAPDTMVTLHRRKDELAVEDVTKTIGREMRTRYLNPQWIQGMKRDNYGGARQMADFAENLWGWQVTVPTAVDAAKWQQVFEVYVEDKYGEDLESFFNAHNPWAYQSMTARMLEAVRKGYWTPDEAVKQKLAAEYALNVVEKGVACCDHTCNNPMLNQMVVNIISLPGVMSPEMVEQFKLAIEKMAAKDLDQQTADRQALLEQLSAAPGRQPPADAPEARNAEKDTAPADAAADTESVEGYKMEEMNTQDQTTELTSSGVQWMASLFVLMVLGLFFWGLRRRRREDE
ncbi:cobalamin biosynthesis protein CobN [Desulfosarcina ovata subsp. sediminis]|uniref:Cobalamin biosynthesis protein CobN n=1 Tax=Desulfosarcina ovata subsp. sediminis TaxID=885957 RepID=A0A5K7ZLY4_9BACT|nr:cobaltochelatase subunit CobN [Desulfosarcina ovata]BBO80679.1 cobalamin biosynthesis protein CobN [Desulfosarcina ovata subsp. sediminis]